MCVDFSDRICRTCSVTGRDRIGLNLTPVDSQLILFPVFRVGLVSEPLKWPIQLDHSKLSARKQV
jgi:hypothetical protein